MPKAYWIANVTITDPDAYKGYQELAPAAFTKYNARFLARGDAVTLEGQPWQRHVVIEFESLTLAQACYASHEYQSARAKRLGAAQADIAIIEGLG